MKPVNRVEILIKLAFRPDEQPGLFNRGGPVVVLLSDVLHHWEEMLKENKRTLIDLKKALAQIQTMRGAERGARVHKRGVKHVFPDRLTIDEDRRVRATCERYSVSYRLIVDAARLYSETNDVRYASWPAAIEVALANDYQWLRGARNATVKRNVGELQPTQQQLAARKVFAAAREARDEREKR